MRGAARGAGVLAALALAGFFAAGAHRQGERVAQNCAFGVEHAADPLPVARRVIYGPRFMRGIDAIAKAIPPDGSYWLVDGNDDPGYGYFVRTALAPRRARYLGRLSALDQGALRVVLSGKPVPSVVLSWQPDGPPVLVDPRSLQQPPTSP